MSISPRQKTYEPAPVPPRRGWTPIKITALVLSLVVLIGIASLGWWLLSPLFVHNTGNAANPFANSSPVISTPSKAASTPVPQGPVTLATGKFIDTANSGRGLNNDHGSGNVTIGKTTDGKYVIHLAQLNVTNGPDLHVYLSTLSNPNAPEQVTNGGVDLGTLSATEGAVNVSVPTAVGTKLQHYHSVVIYCKSFSVIFTVAPLKFTTAS